MDVEMRVSPDGQSIAIRTENDEDAWNAWAYIHRRNGGGWVGGDDVADWTPLTAESR